MVFSLGILIAAAAADVSRLFTSEESADGTSNVEVSATDTNDFHTQPG